MSAKMQGPPKGEPWFWMTREMLRSPHWQQLSINARRLVDFLLLENMDRAGKANGKLLAPRRQLAAFGIGTHYISNAIDEADESGFVDVKRGQGRIASTFALTWLPLFDGTEPTNRWQAVASAKEHSLGMSADQHSLVVSNSTHKTRSECQSALTKPVVSADSGSAKQHPLYREDSFRRGDSKASGEAAEADSTQRDWLLVTDPEGEA